MLVTQARLSWFITSRNWHDNINYTPYNPCVWRLSEKCIFGKYFSKKFPGST